MEQLGSPWTDFHESLYLSNFRQSVETFQVSLKSDKKMGTFREDRYIFMTTPRSFLFRTRNVSSKGVERMITHILR